jgi:hypothetical protein
MRPFRDTESMSAAAAPMRFLVAFVVFGLLAVGGCDLDLENPNAPTEEEVLSSADGIIALAVGMQDQYASAVDDYIMPSSLGTDEWGTDTRSLLSYRTLFNDPAGLDASYDVVETPFAVTYSVVKSADNLIENAPNVGLSTGTETGIVVLARLFKAMALGMAIQIFEEIPLDVSQPGPLPESREAVLTEVLDLLETARSDLGGVTDDDLAGFRSRVLGSGFDLRNTVNAMLARFYLMAGEYQDAIDAADRVDLTVLSTFTYASPDLNPIRNLSLNLIYVAPLASFGEGAEAGDLRPAYWVDTAADPYPGNPADTLLLPLNKYTNNSDPYPVYLPDEMKLIKAEAYTRLSQFGLAAGLVNEVHTQASSALDEPVAGLPEIPADQLDSEAELLAQIAYERRYELYMQGLRWEDTRRLGTAITVTPVHDWLPLPRQECLSNPANPCG